MIPGLLVAVLLLVPSIAHADRLDDVREALARFDARRSIAVAVQVHVDPRGDQPAQSVKLRAIDGPTGLQLIYPRELVAQAREEALEQRVDRERSTPTVRTLRDHVDPLHIAECLDAAGMLQDLLEGGQLIEKQTAALEGVPTELLIVKVRRWVPPEGVEYVREATRFLKLWLGPEDAPVLVESIASVRSGIGILRLNFKIEDHVTWVLARAGKRLIATSREQRVQGEGLGENFATTVRQEMSVEAK